MRSLIARAAFALALAVSPAVLIATERAAHADIMPDDSKPVSHAFAIANGSAFPDYVFLAFPYSASHGRPTTEVAEVTDKPLAAGRWQEPLIYAMKRADFTAAKLDKMTEADLQKFFKSGKALVSKVKIQPTTLVKKASPVESIIELITIDKVDGKTFEARFDKVVYGLAGGQKQELAFPESGNRPEPNVAAVESTGAGETVGPSTPPAATTAAADPTTPVPSPTAPQPPAVTPPSRGCGGCSLTPASGSAGLGLLVGAIVLWQLRRRKPKE